MLGNMVQDLSIDRFRLRDLAGAVVRKRQLDRLLNGESLSGGLLCHGGFSIS